MSDFTIGLITGVVLTLVMVYWALDVHIEGK
jgi:hypothetical protein